MQHLVVESAARVGFGEALVADRVVLVGEPALAGNIAVVGQEAAAEAVGIAGIAASADSKHCWAGLEGEEEPVERGPGAALPPDLAKLLRESEWHIGMALVYSADSMAGC